MNRKQKPKLKSRLRFPEFRNAGEWQKPKLQEISVPVVERVGDRQLTPVSISAGTGFVPQTEKFGRDISGNQYRMYTLVRDGDFVYNKGNSIKYPQGCVYNLEGWGEVAAPNVFICFRLKDGYVNRFFQYCFEKNLHGEQLKKHITSGARSNGLLNLSRDDFFGVEIPVPSTAEQQKIADCLSSIDDLITAETQNLDALKAHEKGLMQQLFPAQGEAVPRLRFPEFVNAGEWREKKLGSIGDIAMCKRVFNNETNSTGGVPFFKIGTLGGNPDGFISRELFELYKSKYSYPREGEVLITCSGTVGKCLPYDGSDAYYQDSNIVWIDNPTLEVRNEFLYWILSAIDWGKLNSTTISRIYGDDLRNLVIRFPSDQNEQRKIADCLSSIDELIVAQRKRVEALKAHKKGLMQQLFPAPDEAQA